MVGELGYHNGVQSLFEKVRISNLDFQNILSFETFNILQNETKNYTSRVKVQSLVKFEVLNFHFQKI